MSRLNLSSIGRFFSTSGSSRAETSSNVQPGGAGKNKPASTGAALNRLSPRTSHTPSTSSAASQRPRAELPRTPKKKVSWTPDTPQNLSLAALMDNEKSTELTRWGMGLKREMKRHGIEDDPELEAIHSKINRNIDADEAGLLPPDDSDSDGDEIRPASRHPAVDLSAMLKQAGISDE